ncbi:nuclear transport factor 2 family protein [uncultured Tateyamaria sp.]|uniref:nuclear transport factor 2 family protein n=1 Tax=uncultured Tateyamaria sp. TaxID=455651 RepID=UPI002624EA90|nr:nuclear transport factor 2 family protein [uncultured Tateyamaria sp.]
MDAQTPSRDAIQVLAETYCDAVHFAKADVFADMCHDKFTMTEVSADGLAQFWDKAAYLERVSGRSAFEGAPVYEIFSIDVAGDEIARVHLRVDVPPKRYEDHLGFIRVDGAWKLMTKVFRTMGGSAMEG